MGNWRFEDIADGSGPRVSNPSVFKPENAKRVNERFRVTITDQDGKVRDTQEFPTNSANKKDHKRALDNAQQYIKDNIRIRRYDATATLTHHYQLQGDPRNETYPNAYYTQHTPWKTGTYRLARNRGGIAQHHFAKSLTELTYVGPVNVPIEETPPSNAEAAGYVGRSGQVRKQAEVARWGNSSQYR